MLKMACTLRMHTHPRLLTKRLIFFLYAFAAKAYHHVVKRNLFPAVRANIPIAVHHHTILADRLIEIIMEYRFALHFPSALFATHFLILLLVASFCYLLSINSSNVNLGHYAARDSIISTLRT